ncbi:branched-chain amino acid transport system II carrier protein [Colibacter massiliensis]|uniref:branched-chain amino acid transport system II carrier protein n=1 Tax=Colibacter massiliensis TaxID=1852379 RepID=UPI00235403AE|nr:branched-chain amino acid transport system II carrier protein [Colibacter massiliensis]
MDNPSRNVVKIKLRDILILGFAFFATYFGAGNLIFPPQLGLVSGTSYGPALAGLTVSGIILPVFALIIISFHGDVRRITEHVGPYTYNVLLTMLMIICTFVSIPRTCARLFNWAYREISRMCPSCRV